MSDVSGSGLITTARASVLIAPSLDATAFKTALTAQLKATQTQLAAVADESLSVKLGTAGSALSGLGGTLSALTKPSLALGAAFVASAENVNSAARTIEQRTGATGQALRDMTSSVKVVATDTGASFRQVASDQSNLADRLDLTGKPLQNLTEQFTNLKRVAGDQAPSVEAVSASLAQFGVPAGEAGKSLDQLLVASQKSGVGVGTLTDQLVATGPILKAVGYDFTGATALLANLGKAGIPASQAMAGLRKAFTAAAKEGEDPKTFLSDLISKIAELSGQGSGGLQKANALAAQFFGARSSTALVSAIQSGRFNIDEMVKSLGGASGAVNKTAADTETFVQQLGKLKNEAALALAPIGDALIPKIRAGFTGLEAVAGAFGKVLSATHTGGIASEFAAGAVVIGATSAAALKLGGGLLSLAGSTAQVGRNIKGAAEGAAGLARRFDESTRSVTLFGAQSPRVLAMAAAEKEAAAATEANVEAQARLVLAQEAAAVAGAEDVLVQDELAAAEIRAAAAAEAEVVANEAVAGSALAGGAALGGLGLVVVGVAAGVALLASDSESAATSVGGVTKALDELAKHKIVAGDLATQYGTQLEGVKSNIAALNNARVIGDKQAQDRLLSNYRDNLDKIDQAIKTKLDNGDIKGAFADLRAVAAKAGVPIKDLLPLLDATTTALHTDREAVAAYRDEQNKAQTVTEKLRSSIDKKAQALRNSEATIKTNLAAEQKLTDAQFAQTDANNAAVDAVRSRDSAAKDLTASEKHLGELTNGYAKDSPTYIAAADAVTQARKDQASKDEALVNAEEAVDKAIQGVADAQREATKGVDDAKDKLHQYQEAVDSAKNSELDAQEAYDKARAQNGRGVDHHEIADAKRRLDEAHQKTIDAQAQQAKGPAEVAEAERAGAEKVQNAQDAVRKARENVTKATQDQADAATKTATAVDDLAKIEFGGSGTAEELAAAQDDAKDKTWALKEANDAVPEALANAQKAQQNYTEDLKNAKIVTDSLIASQLAYDAILSKIPFKGIGNVAASVGLPIDDAGVAKILAGSSGTLPGTRGYTAHADGSSLVPGLNVVNEEGPEIIDWPTGRVDTATRSAQARAKEQADVVARLDALIGVTKEHLTVTRRAVDRKPHRQPRPSPNRASDYALSGAVPL